jgi:hypothetical protein
MRYHGKKLIISWLAVLTFNLLAWYFIVKWIK